MTTALSWEEQVKYNAKDEDDEVTKPSFTEPQN